LTKTAIPVVRARCHSFTHTLTLTRRSTQAHTHTLTHSLTHTHTHTHTKNMHQSHRITPVLKRRSMRAHHKHSHAPIWSRFSLSLLSRSLARSFALSHSLSLSQRSFSFPCLLKFPLIPLSNPFDLLANSYFSELLYPWSQ
jgi:hypothetical protein